MRGSGRVITHYRYTDTHLPGSPTPAISESHLCSLSSDVIIITTRDSREGVSSDPGVTGIKLFLFSASDSSTNIAIITWLPSGLTRTARSELFKINSKKTFSYQFYVYTTKLQALSRHQSTFSLRSRSNCKTLLLIARSQSQKISKRQSL